MKKIYLDHAATTYVSAEVKEAMDQFWSEYYGNPSALYSLGMEAAQALAGARGRVAKILNCNSQELIFVGSGTESDNLALQGVAKTMEVAAGPEGLRPGLRPGGRGEIIVSAIEHDAICNTANYLKDLGWKLKIAKVDQDGLVDQDYFHSLITDKTRIISIMYANNEIGTIQPITELVNIAKKKNKDIVFHTDACQASPYLSLDVEELGVDLMTLNASKVYGPKGVGLLYIKKGTKIKPIIYGGGQEFDLRSGTENIPGIVGFTRALEIAQAKREEESKRLIALRDKLISELQSKIERVNLNGHATERLPNNINLTFEDIEGEAILLHLNEQGIMASTGSACASHSLDVSHVLKAIGLPYELIHGSIRFTMGLQTKEDDIDCVVKAMTEITEKLRAMSPVHLDRDQHPKVKK